MPFQQYPSKGGIPSGNTANRPSSPVIGDTYYNGQLEILEIYNGTAWVANSAPPATPSIATPTDASTGDAYSSTAGKLSVVFTQGSGGGTPSQYNAYTTAGGFSGSSSSTTVTISGLTPGTSYAVYGTAQNNFGTTVNTGTSASVAPTTKPQAPTIGTTTLSNGLPVVNWTLGNNGGKNLTSITITPYLNGTTAQTSRTAATTSSTSYTFTAGQLTEGSSYTFKVKVTNANGDSPESSASNSVTVDAEFSVDYLVVAGGGGNAVGQGGNREAGSGAGGMRTGSTTFIAGTTYTITVGAGGTGQANGVGSSITGSGFTTISCTGGGKGGNNDNAPAGNGGNGGSGGGAWYTNTGGTGVSGEGNPGSNGFTTSEYGGAGGGKGGAGGRGANNGPGEASSITGTSVTYAVGGKANDYPSTTRNANGGANTGNGASGVANGGSGIVVISSSRVAASTTGSPSNPSTGLYIFNGDGSITF
jgi:hypothetical protein